MITLNTEQLKKIEQNKAAALLKKQQCNKQLSAQLPIQGNQNFVKEHNKQTFNKIKFKGQPFRKEPQQESSYILVTFSVISYERFIADTSYHEPSIEIFKSIPGKAYDPITKKWSFPLSEHNNLTSKLRALSSDIVVNAVPDVVLKTIAEPEEQDQVDWSRIDKTLRNSLMPFQVDGVRFGIKKKGRCMIADEMGLGKTIQALGVACYFKENWPLIIVCPSSMRFPWKESIINFLPNINPNITVLTSGKEQTLNGDVIISSYDLMKNCCDQIMKTKFGVIIFDESHSLKSSKSARTKAALQLSRLAKNIILLSGTPALSRPEELYSQISTIDPYTFRTFYDFGMRYCDGKKDKFGWNFSGSSNLEELEVYLRKKIMIRRLKSEVMTQLPSKVRTVVVLHTSMVKSLIKQMKQLEAEYNKQKGVEKHSTLLSYYSMTGNAKVKAVCEYIEDKLENENKFIVFAHHATVMNGISELLDKKGVEYIRIDGSVSSEERQHLCNNFQNKKNCKVAVLSLKAANSGITLTEAQLVIFAELYWNPGELIQAEDRAHRIGQRDSVLIEYLIAKGTADDHLWNIVQSKLNTLNKVGLSEDNFKNTEHKHIEDVPSLTLDMFDGFLKKSENDSEKVEELITVMEDDDIFDTIDLEGIENEYHMNIKKRKTDISS